jgi:betaine-aldehyde dehydrogenase
MLVPQGRYEEAAKLAAEAAKSFAVGDPLDEKARLGPLSSQAQLEKVRNFIKKGIAEGAELLAGGYYVRPTVFGRVKNSMTIAQEEIFGPVLSIIPYQDEEDAVRIANDSPYGLAGAVWSADEARAQRVARRIRAGQVDVNGGAFNMNAPFGGFKQSGHGREAGVYGLEEFLEYKSLQLKG